MSCLAPQFKCPPDSRPSNGKIRDFSYFRVQCVMSSAIVMDSEKLQISSSVSSLRPLPYIGSIGPPSKIDFDEATLANENLLADEESMIAAAAAEAVALARTAAEVAKNAAQMIGSIPSSSSSSKHHKHDELSFPSEFELLKLEMAKDEENGLDQDHSSKMNGCDLLEEEHSETIAVRSGKQTERKARRARASVDMSFCSGAAGIGTAGGGAASCRLLHVPSAGGGRSAVLISPLRSISYSFALRASSLANGADPGDGGSVDPRKVREVRHQLGRAEEVCEVDVVSWRERRIKARIPVAADVGSVWSVLTDYERLANFIPNLIFSRTIPCPHPGRVWLEQRGLQRALYWCIEARVLLELQEIDASGNGRELLFSMVDGDFKKFEGKWSVKTGPRSSTVTLFYEVNVIPRFNFPAIFIERIIRSDLPVNLQALAWRAERRFADCQKKHPTEGASRQSEESYAGPSLTTPSEMVNSLSGFRKACRLDRPRSVDEVHVRKVNGKLENGGAHRCVVASITVKAPLCRVWETLTAYEALTEIVPNLAISKILLRENNKVRILQEGCKGLLYMVLHARVILDLHETLKQEITFEQVEGDFDSFRGKWLFEQLGNDHTLLKYSVESKLRRDSFLSDALLEEVIYEDLPANLCSIRDYIERRENAKECSQRPRSMFSETSAGSSGGGGSAEMPRKRPKVPGLQRDVEILKGEILAFVSEHGQKGFMPMRKQLRVHGRVDIEKAITRMGGFREIAALMNLSLAYKLRKPKGYWDDLENLRQEISRFQKSWGMDPTFMPSRKSFERAGRYDIARALEKWGGLQEVSRLLSLELRNPRRPPELASGRSGGGGAGSDEDDHWDDISRPCISQDTQKWLMKLKDLDINWAE